MVQVGVVVLFPIGLFMVVFVSGPGYPQDFVPRLIGILVFLSGMDLLGLSLLQVREVRSDSKGVAFRYLFHTERRSWEDLEPSTLAPRHKEWYLLSRSREGRKAGQRSFLLTLEQARAVLADASCPRWQLTPQVAQGLAMLPAGSSASSAS
jgi:hypothetical protein